MKEMGKISVLLRKMSIAAVLTIILVDFTSGRLSVSQNYFVPAEWNGSKIVRTRCGLIEGRPEESGTLCWKGIPYAQPPVGELRWKAPRDVLPWNGVMKAFRFGPKPPQIVHLLFPVVSGSEDCLYLNVWRPDTAQTNLPVYVFIHGGGNTMGYAARRSTFGNRFARRMNAVYVSIEYRLGIFGWFYSPAVSEGGSPEDVSGNFGLLDMAQALKWVKENIGAFGGDSNCVTVAGESAGAIDILAMLISPAAQGLFERAVIESGLEQTSSVDEARKYSAGILKKLLTADRLANRLDGMSDSDIKHYLYSKSPKELLSVQESYLTGGMYQIPYLIRDGLVLPTNGFRTLLDGTYPNKVPIVIGCNKEEYKFFLYFLKKYPADSVSYANTAEVISEAWQIAGAYSVAGAIASRPEGKPVYVYRFDWGAPDADGVSVLPGDCGRQLGAGHAMEIPFFLDSGEPALSFLFGKLFTAENEGGRIELTSAITTYLSAFIRSGNPNNAEFPVWPAWTNRTNTANGLVLDAGFRNLRLSYLTNELTVQSVVQKARSELDEDDLKWTLKMIAEYERQQN